MGKVPLATAGRRSDGKRAAGLNDLWLTFLICKMGIVLVMTFFGYKWQKANVI